jgi:Flp pilus assembly protein TadD
MRPFVLPSCKEYSLLHAYNPAMENAPVSAEDYFYSGTHLLGEGEMVAAETAFRRALTLAPDMTEAHANLGWLLEQLKRSQEAELHYRQALTLDPAQVQTLINFGAFLTAQ